MWLFYLRDAAGDTAGSSRQGRLPGLEQKKKAANSERLLFSFGEGIFCFLWGVTKNYI